MARLVGILTRWALGSVVGCLWPGVLLGQTSAVVEMEIPWSDLVAAPSAVTDEAGNLYVSQPLDFVIRVFDRNGHLLGELGRRGHGPGEFQQLGLVGAIGDTIFAPDRVLARTTFFNGDSAWTRRWELPAYDGLLPDVPSGFFADGSAFSVPGVPSISVSRGLVSTLPLLRVHQEGLDTLALIDVTRSVWAIETPDARSSGGQPFAETTLWAHSPRGDGVFLVDRTTDGGFEVTFVGFHGDVRWQHQYDAPRPRVSRAMIDSVVALRVERLGERFQNHPAPGRALRRALHVPDRVPAVESARVGRNGVLWVKMRRPIDRVCWWLVDPEGRLYGSVQVVAGNASIGWIWADSAALWVRRRDQLGLESVVRYRLEEPEESERLC